MGEFHIFPIDGNPRPRQMPVFPPWASLSEEVHRNPQWPPDELLWRSRGEDRCLNEHISSFGNVWGYIYIYNHVYIYIVIYIHIIMYIYMYVQKYVCMYIYIIHIWYIIYYIYMSPDSGSLAPPHGMVPQGPVLRLSTPPWVGSPGSSPNSLLFAGYWQHFWGPASYLLGLCSISDYQPRIY